MTKPSKIQSSKKILITVTAFILLIVLSLGFLKMDIFSVNKNPIGGNMLHIPCGAEWDDTPTITSPWKNLQFHTGLMYRSLFLADSTLQVVEPDMVDKYKILENGTKYEFVLKDNMKWSDGEPITAEDVAFSIEAVLQGTDTNGMYPSAFSNIQGASDFIEGKTTHIQGLEVNGNTIKIKMDSIYPTFFQVLAQFVILPKHCLENEDLAELPLSKFWRNPVVSGMYKFGEVKPYEYVQLVRNEYYTETPPRIDEVYLQLDYKHVDLDYHTTANSTEIINYRSMKDMKEYQVDALFYRYLVFNLQGSEKNRISGNASKVMQDKNLREAISYAIDSESLLKNIYFDFGAIMDYGVPRSSGYYNNVSRSYDPEKAKELLKKSSYDMERPLVLGYYYTDSVSKYFMENMANNLEEVGFKVELKQLKNAEELYDVREYDIMLKGLAAFGLNEWYAEYVSTTPTVSKLLGTDTGFDPLFKELSSSVSETDIRDNLIKLQELEQEKLYKIPLFTLSQMVYVRSNRVCIPEDVVFGNTWYKYDVDFEKWYIKSE